MSEMSQMSKLKNRIKTERNNIFEIGQMRKVAQNFLKNWLFFYYPRHLQYMQIIWVNFFINMGHGWKFDHIYSLSVFVCIILSKFGLKFPSITHIYEKDYPDYLHAL